MKNALVRMSASLSGADWSPERGDIFTRDTLVLGTLRYRHDFVPQDFAHEVSASGLRMVSDEQTGHLRCAVAIREDSARRQ